MCLKQKSLSNILIYNKLVFSKFYDTYFFLNESLNKYLLFLYRSEKYKFSTIKMNKLLFTYENLKEYDIMLNEINIKNKSNTKKIYKNRIKMIAASKKIIKKTYLVKCNKSNKEISNKTIFFSENFKKELKFNHENYNLFKNSKNHLSFNKLNEEIYNEQTVDENSLKNNKKNLYKKIKKLLK